MRPTEDAVGTAKTFPNSGSSVEIQYLYLKLLQKTSGILVMLKSLHVFSNKFQIKFAYLNDHC